MDSTAFQELIALARNTAAELAATEKKVSAFKDELAHQDHRAQLNASAAMSRSITITPKPINSGWIPEGKPSTTRRAASAAQTCRPGVGLPYDIEVTRNSAVTNYRQSGCRRSSGGSAPFNGDGPG